MKMESEKGNSENEMATWLEQALEREAMEKGRVPDREKLRQDTEELMEIWREVPVEEHRFSKETAKAQVFRRISAEKRRVWQMVMAGSVAACIVFIVGIFSAPYLVPSKDKELVVVELKDRATVLFAGGEALDLDNISTDEMTAKLGEGVYYDKEKRFLDLSKAIIGEREMRLLRNPRGKRMSVALADGSKVWLNAGTELRFPSRFKNKSRNVSVKGQAYFKVTKKGSPFFVNTKGMKVRVLGTEFGVKGYPGERRHITLVEGSVSLESENGKTVLKPSEQGVLVSGGKLKRRKVYVDEYVGWKNNRLIFKNKSFEELRPRLERWFDVTFVGSESLSRKDRFTGSFTENDGIDMVMELFLFNSDLKYEKNTNYVYIEK
ncbi:hypothetical protein FUAX_43230 (plasmid) [Fulvitalea axinellae]|uniref:FecR family protein n=1 Tax=Fulvitalea axinellae TaxID=1182444 RepID=A0AAU9DFH5_9BACT|nr:hypothetical protein FUAX_43230 [Fulvitalea axinellae]